MAEREEEGDMGLRGIEFKKEQGGKGIIYKKNKEGISQGTEQFQMVGNRTDVNGFVLFLILINNQNDKI